MGESLVLSATAIGTYAFVAKPVRMISLQKQQRTVRASESGLAEHKGKMQGYFPVVMYVPECPDCGATDSALIYPKRIRENAHTQPKEKISNFA